MLMTAAERESVIEYPSSDGKSMAESTTQFDWITKVKGGFEALFRRDPMVFVAGDLLWYPVKGRRDICRAPDAMVAFGRPKGPRMSYRQFDEGNVAPQVVVEILSESNDEKDLAEKFEFYQLYGVEEYYVYDPKPRHLEGWRRAGPLLVPIPNIGAGYTSPRLNVHFRLDPEWVLTGPDGRPFVDYPVLAEQREAETLRADELAELADQESRRADEKARRAADQKRRADEEARRADAAQRELEELRALLQARGISLTNPPA